MNEILDPLSGSAGPDGQSDAGGFLFSDAHIERMTKIVVRDAARCLVPLLEQVKQVVVAIQNERVAGGIPAQDPTAGPQPTLQELAQKKLNGAELRVQVRLQKLMSRQL
jgi:hypothetical protein